MENPALWEKVCSYQNLRLAGNKVKEKEGGPGVDRMTVEEFEQNLEGNLNTLQNQLENGAYKPLPVLRIYIDKEGGTMRSIGIPVVIDRVVQQALLSVLSPIFEGEFLDCSFAYRPGRSALNSYIELKKQLAGVEKSIQRIEADMGSYFDKSGTDTIV